MSTDFSVEERWRDACASLIDGYFFYNDEQLYWRVVEIALELKDVIEEAKVFFDIAYRFRLGMRAEAIKAFVKEAEEQKTNGFLWYVAALLLKSRLMMNQASALNYSHAQAIDFAFDGDHPHELQIQNTMKAAEKQSRQAFFNLALLNRNDIAVYRANMKKAADAGFMDAVIRMIDDPIMFTNEVDQWRWICVYVFKGGVAFFTSYLGQFYEEGRRGPDNRSITFLIGKCIYRSMYEICLPDRIPRLKLRDFYLNQVKAARNAVLAADLCFKRLHICKDVRRLICQWVWAGREEANYFIPI
ncbi:MAG: hypothetical protein K2Q45_02385 [Nitrosomonas sp.]|nr:hypothetical protein [Nitrosomonas sp.]